jgi:hypothetical protein
MKEFRKNQEGQFICEECGRLFKNLNGLSQHVTYCLSGPEYYHKYLFENHDEKCKICNKDVKFLSLGYGYFEVCSNVCKRENVKQKLYKNYRIENNFQREDVINKIKETKFRNHGDENYNNTLKNKETKFRNHGDENYNNTAKIKETKINNYGSDYASIIINKGRKVRKLKYKNGWFDGEKLKASTLKKYGVEYNHQNIDVLQKSLKSGFKLKQFRDINLWYQGSYELDFLEKYYDKYPDLEKGPSLKYKFKGMNKIYHPDFYIPSLNLIIEIKNSYLMQADNKKITLKREAAKSKSFNYIIIVDKNYKEFTHKYLH